MGKPGCSVQDVCCLPGAASQLCSHPKLSPHHCTPHCEEGHLKDTGKPGHLGGYLPVRPSKSSMRAQSPQDMQGCPEHRGSHFSFWEGTPWARRKGASQGNGQPHLHTWCQQHRKTAAVAATAPRVHMSMCPCVCTCVCCVHRSLGPAWTWASH